MIRYLESVFVAQWIFRAENYKEYIVLKDANEIFSLYQLSDVKSLNHNTYVVNQKHKKLNGTFKEHGERNYVSVKDNLLHSTTAGAILLYGGLDTFTIGKYVESYLLYGKKFSHRSWLSWLKNSSSWPETMASLLGNKEIC